MLTEEQLDAITNRLEAAHSYLNSINTKPNPVDLYYPIKRAGVGTGWGYRCSGIIVEDLDTAATAIKELRAALRGRSA